MANRKKRLPYNKQNLSKLKRDAIENARPQPTEDDSDNPDVSDAKTAAKSAKVPVEHSPIEIISNLFQQWLPWVTGFGILSAAIFAYSTFKNDIYNAKSDINNLRAISGNNSTSIFKLEKKQVKHEVNMSHLESGVQSLKIDIHRIDGNLKDIEIEQAKQISLETINRGALTKPSSGRSR
ncbi:MAG: hypothetical protein RPT95_10305 [Candidatus Sedimenticola sp. (ex Thyasira tokunagai)]